MDVIDDRNFTPLFLPPYTPVLQPIECFAVLKAYRSLSYLAIWPEDLCHLGAFTRLCGSILGTSTCIEETFTFIPHSG